MSVNGFADADLRTLPTAVIQNDIASVTNAIALRLQGNAPESAETFTINGKVTSRTPLQFLYELRSALYRALALQTYEPSGLGIGLVADARQGGPFYSQNWGNPRYGW